MGSFASCGRRIVAVLALSLTLTAPQMLPAQLPLFTFATDDLTIPYDVGSGEGSGVLRITNQEVPGPGFPHDVQGWNMALAHDAALVSPVLIEQGAYIQSLNGGNGPDFWGSTILDGGFTIGTVYCYLGLCSCVYDIPREIVLATYETVPSALAGDVDGASVLLEDATLGTPPMTSTVVTGGAPGPVQWEFGSFDLVPAGAFRRGDCNQDTAVDISDPIFLGAALFAGGPGFGCADACDGNDDGIVDIADVVYVPQHLFAGGPPPPPPGGQCGFDPTADGLDCASALSCP